MAIAELLRSFERDNGSPNFIPFPSSPKEISVGQFRVWEYINPNRMRQVIKHLSDSIDLRQFDGVLVNRRGGNFLADQITNARNHKGVFDEIEVHRVEEEPGAREVRGIPTELYKRKVLVIDDIYDTGRVFRYILQRVSPDSTFVALVKKRGISGQVPIPNCVVGVEIENKWVGGCGMDLGFDGEEDIFRNYPGIVVKIPDASH